MKLAKSYLFLKKTVNDSMPCSKTSTVYENFGTFSRFLFLFYDILLRFTIVSSQIFKIKTSSKQAVDSSITECFSFFSDALRKSFTQKMKTTEFRVKEKTSLKLRILKERFRGGRCSNTAEQQPSQTLLYHLFMR